MIQSIEQGTFGSRLAVPTLLLLPFAILAHRFGLLNFQLATALLALCFLLSLAIFICSIVAYIRNSEADFRSNLRTTMLISVVMPVLVVGLVIAAVMRGGETMPRIHDITTDTVNVPRFVVGATERGSGSNSLAVEPEVIAQQVAAYPQIKTHRSDLPVEQAFALAQSTAAEMGWTIYNTDAARGIIEASDKTPLWGFIDDVVIRIAADPNGSGSLVDLRSVSRVGQGDIGANAARIEKFINTFKSQS